MLPILTSSTPPTASAPRSSLIATLALFSLLFFSLPGFAAECGGTLEVAFVDAAGSPAAVAAAEVSVGRVAEGGFRVEKISGLLEGTDGLRLDVRAGNHRVEVGFVGSADRLGQAATFVRSFDAKLACGQNLRLEVEVPAPSKAAVGLADADFTSPAELPGSILGRKVGELIEEVAGNDAVTKAGKTDDGSTKVLSSGETFYCAWDFFDDNQANVAPWTLSQIGDVDQAAVAEAGGRLLLTGDGTELYHGADHTAFYHQSITGDFRAEISLESFADSLGGGFRKAGLMVRTGTGANDPRIMIAYVPNHPTYNRPALQFDYRGTDGVARELASTPLGLPMPLRMAIDRRGNLFQVYFSTNGGASWSTPAGAAGGRITLNLPATLQVGPNVTSYSATQATTATFSRFELCSPDGSALPGPGPGAACSPNRPLEILYLLDISGSMTLPYPGAPSKIDAARAAIAQVNDVLAAQAPNTEVALIAFNGKDNPSYNLISSTRILAHFTNDYAAIEAAAATINPASIDPRTTTPTAIALKKAIEMLEAEHTPSALPIVVLFTDTVPNIDSDGYGPSQYTFNEIQNISLYDGLGNFRPFGQVAWSGNYNASRHTYDGEVLANAMYELEELRDRIADVIFYGVAIQGDGVASQVFREDLLDYGAYLTGGDVFSAANAGDLGNSLVSIINILDCGGSLGDRVWLDSDADGVQDPLEPGLPGIPVEVYNSSNTLVATVVTDANGNYSVDSLLPGSYTVRIAASSLAGLAQTYDLDGLSSANQATVSVAAYQDRTDVDFGYRMTAPEPGCRTDAFDDGFVSFFWQPEAIGDDNAGSMVEAGGVFTIGSNGSDLYHGPDNGFMAAQAVSGDFRVEIDVVDFPQDLGGQYRKAGLTMREDDSPGAARVMAMVVPHFPPSNVAALQFDVRLVTNGTPVEMSSTVQGISLPVRLAIQRRGSTVEVFYSSNGGTTWVKPLGAQGGDVDMPALGSSVLVGPMAASYDRGQVFKASFDDFEICQPDPEIIVPPPPVDCVPGQPLDVVILLDQSGSMTWTYTSGMSKFTASKNAAMALVNAIGALNNGSRAALVTFTGRGDDPAYNLNSAVFMRSPLTTDTVALASLIDGLSMQGISPLATTPLPIAYGTVTNLFATQALATHAPVVIQIGDLLPNIDLQGRGPREYPLMELFDLPLMSGGNWLAPGVVAWSGTYHGTTETYTGETLANGMVKIQEMKAAHPTVRIFGAVTIGNGVDLGTSSLSLAEYAAYFTGGAAIPAHNSDTVTLTVLQLLGVALCNENGSATIGDRVWYDQDGDGAQDNGENGIAGVTVNLLGAGNVVVATTTTDAGGSYIFGGVLPGTYTVAVDPTTLPLTQRLPTYDRDGVASANTAVVTVQAFEVRLDVDFGYDLIEGPAPEPVQGCFTDNFDDDTLAAGWGTGFLGNGNAGGAVEAGGTLAVTGNGAQLFAEDHGFMTYRSVNNEFLRAEVEIVGSVSGGASIYEKTGLTMTTSLDAKAPRVTVQYQPNWPDSRGSLQFRYRASAGGDGGQTWASTVVNVRLPVRVAIEKNGDTYTGSYSYDGVTWVRPGGGLQGTVTIPMGDVLLVGMSATSYDAGATTVTGRYDNFSLCNLNPVVSEDCVTEANNGHAVWMPGISSNLVPDASNPGRFLRYADGTAHFEMTVHHVSDANKIFDVVVDLTGRTNVTPPGSPKKELAGSSYVPTGPIDPSTWYYYPAFTGTLTGRGAWSGALIEISRIGPSWQEGVGANGKNLLYGASAWFTVDVVNQPTSGPALVLSNDHGDFNVELSCEPGFGQTKMGGRKGRPPVGTTTPTAPGLKSDN